MKDHRKLSQTELTAFEENVLFNLNLDKKILEKHFALRLHLHKEQAHQILQQEQDKQQKKETAILLCLLFWEPFTRSHIKSTLKTSPNKEEVVKELIPFHRDIKGLIEEIRQKVFSFSQPMQEIISKEKDAYKQLLEELTEVIRLHSAGPITPTLPQQENVSPLQELVKETQAKITETVQLAADAYTILITVAPEDFQRVIDAFSPYVAPEQEEALSTLFTTGSSAVIYFKGPNKQLGDFFRRLKDKGVLLGISYYTELAEWLSQHFYFKNKDKGGFTPVSRKSILKVLQDGDRPKDIIKF
jgi:hypothetical protein